MNYYYNAEYDAENRNNEVADNDDVGFLFTNIVSARPDPRIREMFLFFSSDILPTDETRAKKVATTRNDFYLNEQGVLYLIGRVKNRIYEQLVIPTLDRGSLLYHDDSLAGHGELVESSNVSRKNIGGQI